MRRPVGQGAAAHAPCGRCTRPGCGTCPAASLLVLVPVLLLLQQLVAAAGAVTPRPGQHVLAERFAPAHVAAAPERAPAQEGSMKPAAEPAAGASRGSTSGADPHGNQAPGHAEPHAPHASGAARGGPPEGPGNGLLQAALQFLSRNMPPADRAAVSDGDLVRTAVLALRARRASRWARAVPLGVFLNDVLPYRHLDEPPEMWRRAFHGRLAPLVANATSAAEAAQVGWRGGAGCGAAPIWGALRPCTPHSLLCLISPTLRCALAPASPPPATPPRQIINQHVWGIFHDPPIFFKPDQTPEIMSPSQVIAKGYASCTGLSIFLASACRSVGVPARVAGAQIPKPGQAWLTSSA
jgi:hypothetical protein